MKITEILMKQELIYRAIQEWGFNIEKSAPPQLYVDLYEDSGAAKLCLLLKTHPDLDDVSTRRHFLEYELENLLNCAVSAIQLDNLVGERQQKQVEKEAISLLSEQKTIIQYYGGENYSFISAEKDSLLALPEAERSRKQLKQHIQQKLSAVGLRNFSGTLLAPPTTLPHKPIGGDEDMSRLLECIRSDTLVNESVKRDPALLLRAYQHLASNITTERQSIISS